MMLPESACALIRAGAPAHLVTLNSDGSPQVTLVWVGLDGEELVAAHLFESQKVRNVRQDGRVALTFESPTKSTLGLTEYLVIYGIARIEEGGAAALLQTLAEVYLSPGIKFPAMDDPPPGYIMRIQIDRISGVGPWTGRPV